MGEITFQFPLIFSHFKLPKYPLYCCGWRGMALSLLMLSFSSPKNCWNTLMASSLLTASQLRQNRMRSSLFSVWTFYAVLLFWVHLLFPQVRVQFSPDRQIWKKKLKKSTSWSSKLKTYNLARKKKNDTEVIQSLFISVGMTDGCFSSALWLFPLLWFEFKIFIKIFKLQIIVIFKHPKSWRTSTQDT